MRSAVRKTSLLLLLPVLIIATFGFLQYRSTVSSRNEVDSFISSNLPHMNVTHGKVSANLFTGMTTVHDIRVELDSANHKQSLLISGLSYHKNTDSKGALERLRVDVDDMKMPLDKASMEPAAKDFFDRLKTDVLAANFHFDYHYNPKTQSLEFFAKNIFTDLADSNLTLQLADFSPSLLNLTNVMGTKIRFLQWTYHDHSLVSRSIDMLALKLGKPREEFLKDLQGRLQTRADQTEGIHPAEKLLVSSLVTFVQHPGTLTITLRPDQTVALGDLLKASTPEELEKLGLKIQQS